MYRITVEKELSNASEARAMRSEGQGEAVREGEESESLGSLCQFDRPQASQGEEKVMKWFREFLELVATPGGNLIILCSAVIISGVAAVLVANRAENVRNTEVDNFMLSVFSGFSGALLQALSSRPMRPGEAIDREKAHDIEAKHG